MHIGMGIRPELLELGPILRVPFRIVPGTGDFQPLVVGHETLRRFVAAPAEDDRVADGVCASPTP